MKNYEDENFEWQILYDIILYDGVWCLTRWKKLINHHKNTGIIAIFKNEEYQINEKTAIFKFEVLKQMYKMEI